MARAYTFILVALVALGVVFALPSDLALRQLKKVQEAQARGIEFFSQKLKTRRLQDEDVPPEIAACQNTQCPAGTPQDQPCEAQIDCVVDAMNTLILPCFDNFGTMGTVYRCYLGFLVQGDNTATSVQLSSGNTSTFDDADSGFDVANPTPTEQQCTTFFAPGNEIIFASVACMSRLDTAQSFVNFLNAAENNFAGLSGCSSLASALGGGSSGGSEDSTSESTDGSDQAAQEFDLVLGNITGFVNECDQYVNINSQIDSVLSSAPQNTITIMFTMVIATILYLS